jgi:DNA-binding CsgD family transcriptional regulator
MDLFLNNPNCDDLTSFLLNNINPDIGNRYVLSEKGIILQCNDAAALVAGLDTAQDFIGNSSYSYINPQAGVVVRDNDHKVLAVNKLMVFTEPYINFEGKRMIATSIKATLKLRHRNKTLITGISFTIEDTDSQVAQNLYKLTRKQMECLYWFAKGNAVKQIARKMDLSARTVEHYVEKIKLKMNATLRSELVAKALEIPCIRNRLQQLDDTTGFPI